jgi:23S rRNA pseudouridine2604 synthase
MEFPIRINKYLAEQGYATRRGADALIASGKVRVNGTPAVIGQKIAKTDKVEVAATSASSRYRYILYYKPAGILTSEEADNTADNLVHYVQKKNGIKGLFPIGRLDKDTEGLIVLTNDGRITRSFASSDTFAEQVYEVTVDKRVTGTFLNRLSKGVRLDDYMTGPAQVTVGSNDRVFTIALREGRKHHIRRMCAALGYSVVQLVRTRIGTLELKALKPGTFHELAGKEVTALYAQLGLKN